MWKTIELRELRVFLTLAEELHFGRSAERLGLTQSRVSQSLRELEHKVGGQLLHRTTRNVRLTPFGEEFRERLDPIYGALANVLSQTPAASGRCEGMLRLGLLYPTAGGPHMTTIISRFEQLHPSCEVELTEILFDDLLGPLRRAEVDMLATRLPIEQPDLSVGPVLSREPRVLQVAVDHPLAGRETVSVEDLADCHVLPLDGFPEELVARAVPYTTPSGRPIPRRRLRHMPRTPYDVEALIARGAIVHPSVRSYAEYYGHPGVTHVPIRDMPPSETGLVWRRQASDSRHREFVRVAREVLKAAPLEQEAQPGRARLE
jgi:DNA-binding transcriptional LysR family regulator